jgi:hypothetical protein
VAVAFAVTVLTLLLLFGSKAHADSLPLDGTPVTTSTATSVPPLSVEPTVDAVQPAAVMPTPALSTADTPDPTPVAQAATDIVTDVVTPTLSSDGVASTSVDDATALPSASSVLDTNALAPDGEVMTSTTSLDAVPAPAPVVQDAPFTTALSVPVDIARVTTPAAVDPTPRASSQPTKPSLVATSSRARFRPVLRIPTRSWTSQLPVVTGPHVSASVPFDTGESSKPARAPADPSRVSTTSLPQPRPTQPERGEEVLLFVLAAALAWSDPRVRRVLLLGAVTPRDSFVSLIERPG